MCVGNLETGIIELYVFVFQISLPKTHQTSFTIAERYTAPDNYLVLDKKVSLTIFIFTQLNSYAAKAKVPVIRPSRSSIIRGLRVDTLESSSESLFSWLLLSNPFP